MVSSNLKWLSWREENAEHPLSLYLTEIENGLLLIISDKGPRLGTIAIGTPNLQIKGRTSISSVPIVFGFRNELFSRAIAERIAKLCQKIVIASVFLSMESPELARRALNFTENSIKKYQSERGK
ncbi:MAG: hypothetical protein ACTSRS_18435 [Candidatus Helarchaeota archaeon]